MIEGGNIGDHGLSRKIESKNPFIPNYSTSANESIDLFPTDACS